MVYGLVAPGYEMAEVAAANLAGLDPDLHRLRHVDQAEAHGGGRRQLRRPLRRGDGREGLDVRRPVRRRLQEAGRSTPDGTRLLGGVLVGDASDFGTLLALFKSGKPLAVPPGDLLSAGRRTPRCGGEIDAQVCSCNNVSERQIREAIRDQKLTTVAEVKTCTQAGTGCGGCLPRVTDLLKAELKAAGARVDNRLCEHFPHSRQELFQIAMIQGIKTFDALIAAHGTGHGCEVCKPAVASILASLWNENVLDPAHATLQDTNDRFLANIQRGGTYSVVPRVPGGEITPEKLIVLGEVARKYGLYTKITGGQRIDLFGAPVHLLPEIWAELIAAGFESGHAYGKAVRTVKSCVGSTWCRYGVQDSVGFAIRVELRYRGLRAPHKLKGAVSGCVRECAEAQGKDFGLIATEKGYNLYVCGNGGARPRHADLLAADLDEDTAIRYLDRFLMYYIRTADRLTRTSVWLESMEGGIEYLRDVIVNDRLGIGAELERQMQALVDSYQCEWKAVVDDPEKRRFFQQFANTDEVDAGNRVRLGARARSGPPTGRPTSCRSTASKPRQPLGGAGRARTPLGPRRVGERLPPGRRPGDQARHGGDRGLPVRVPRRVVRLPEHLPAQARGGPLPRHPRRPAGRPEGRLPAAQEDLFARVGCVPQRRGLPGRGLPGEGRGRRRVRRAAARAGDGTTGAPKPGPCTVACV